MSTYEPDVPTKDEMSLPILRCLSNGQVMTVDELVMAVVKDMGLPTSVLNRKATNKVKSEFKNRLEWACTDLRKKGYIDYPVNPRTGHKSGNRVITEAGLKALKDKSRGRT